MSLAGWRRMQNMSSEGGTSSVIRLHVEQLMFPEATTRRERRKFPQPLKCCWATLSINRIRAIWMFKPQHQNSIEHYIKALSDGVKDLLWIIDFPAWKFETAMIERIENKFKAFLPCSNIDINTFFLWIHKMPQKISILNKFRPFTRAVQQVKSSCVSNW